MFVGPELDLLVKSQPSWDAFSALDAPSSTLVFAFKEKDLAEDIN